MLGLGVSLITVDLLLRWLSDRKCGTQSVNNLSKSILYIPVSWCERWLSRKILSSNCWIGVDDVDKVNDVWWSDLAVEWSCWFSSRNWLVRLIGSLFAVVIWSITCSILMLSPAISMRFGLGFTGLEKFLLCSRLSVVLSRVAYPWDMKHSDIGNVDRWVNGNWEGGSI